MDRTWTADQNGAGTVPRGGGNRARVRKSFAIRDALPMPVLGGDGLEGIREAVASPLGLPLVRLSPHHRVSVAPEPLQATIKVPAPPALPNQQPQRPYAAVYVALRHYQSGTRTGGCASRAGEVGTGAGVRASPNVAFDPVRVPTTPCTSAWYRWGPYSGGWPLCWTASGPRAQRHVVPDRSGLRHALIGSDDRSLDGRWIRSFRCGWRARIHNGLMHRGLESFGRRSRSPSELRRRFTIGTRPTSTNALPDPQR